MGGWWKCRECTAYTRNAFAVCGYCGAGYKQFSAKSDGATVNVDFLPPKGKGKGRGKKPGGTGKGRGTGKSAKSGGKSGKS